MREEDQQFNKPKNMSAERSETSRKVKQLQLGGTAVISGLQLSQKKTSQEWTQTVWDQMPMFGTNNMPLWQGELATSISLNA